MRSCEMTSSTNRPRPDGVGLRSGQKYRLWNRDGQCLTVAPLPPATSKWNPIEHRLFCEISKELGGPPPRQLPDHPEIPTDHTYRHRIADARAPHEETYKTGVKVTEAEMHELRLTPDDVLPKWNYTVEPVEPM